MKSEFFWDKISRNYDNQVGKKYQQTYTDTIEKTKKYLNKSDVVLDFACGTGITTLQIANCVKEIYAIDISQNMIDIAEEKAKNNEIDNIQFWKTDLFHETFEKGFFDVILAYNILYFIKNAQKNVTRIHELLKPEGLFISVTDCLGEKISLLNRIHHFLSRIGMLPFMKMYSISELEGVVTEGNFSIVETANLYDTPPNYFIVAKKNA